MRYAASGEIQGVGRCGGGVRTCGFECERQMINCEDDVGCESAVDLVNMNVRAVKQLAHHCGWLQSAKEAPGRGLPRASHARAVAIAEDTVVRDEQLARPNPLDCDASHVLQTFDSSGVQKHGDGAFVVGVGCAAIV